MADLTRTFSALGDGTRLALVERLLQQGEQSASMLQSVADISLPAISRHLKVLREAGVICRRVDGQRRLYRVDPAALVSVNAWLDFYRNYWDHSLDRLERALQAKGANDGGTED